MTAEKFKSICKEKGITWNDLVRIRVIKPKKNVLISMNTYICQKIRLRSILIKKENVI